MLIFLLIIGVILFAAVTIGMRLSKVKYGLVAVTLLMVLSALAMLTVNDVSYWGMTKRTTTVDKPLSSAADIQGTETVLYQALGNGQEKVFIYKTTDKQKKVTTTKADVSVTNKVVRNTNILHPILKTKTVRYVYKNDFYKFLFAGINGNNRYVKQTNTFEVPTSWVILSTKQVKQLEKQAKTAAKATKAQMQQVVSQQVAQAKAQNPTMTAAEQKTLTQTIQKQVTEQAAQEVHTKLESLSLK